MKLLGVEPDVEIVMAELAQVPSGQPKRPAFPNHQRSGGPPSTGTANAVRR